MSREIPRQKTMADAYREMYQLDEAPTSVGTTDQDRKTGFYNIPGKGKRFWDGKQWKLESPGTALGKGVGDAWKSSMDAVKNLAAPVTRNLGRAAHSDPA